MNELYPVYIVLFSNDTKFGRLIKKMTGQNYSHAVISLDSSLNNMYSFSTIPFNHSLLSSDGFVRESIWSPMYESNKFFTVMVTFTDKEGLNKINNKIESFKRNYTKQKYNDIGLIKYYLNFKDTKDRDENKKQRWFCSEFVTYILKSGNIEGFEDILQSPQDLTTLTPNAISLGDFTIKSFSEADLKRRTSVAKKEYLRQRMMSVPEASYDSLTEAVITTSMINKIAVKKESEVTKYTALLDWKKLYDYFTETFKYSDPQIRFPMIELIVRKYFIPFKVSAVDATEKLINEMNQIYSNIKGRVINFIDVPNSEIYIYMNHKTKPLKYPDFFHTKK